MKKFLKGLAGIGVLASAVFVLSVGPARAFQVIDGYLQAGYIQFFSNGVYKWYLGTVPALNDSIRFHEAGPTEQDVVEVSTTGAVQMKVSVVIPNYTSTQISTRSPFSPGELVYNTTINTICVSTGTGIEAYTRLSTGTLAPAAATCQ